MGAAFVGVRARARLCSETPMHVSCSSGTMTPRRRH